MDGGCNVLRRVVYDVLIMRDKMRMRINPAPGELNCGSFNILNRIEERRRENQRIELKRRNVRKEREKIPSLSLGD